MNKPTLLSMSLIATTVLAGNVQADGLHFGKPIESKVTITSNQPGLAANATKTVTTMEVKLTPEQRKLYTTFPSINMSFNRSDLKNKYPAYLDLGMNNVPVLDQGRHGSCVTFAVTAAIDALLYKRDHISQLCSLELGKTIADTSYSWSGWDGTFAHLVLNQLYTYGVVTKDQQTTKSCAGVTEYPMRDQYDTGKAMPFADYHALSNNIADKISWYSLLSDFERMQWSPTSNQDGEKLLNKIKQTLNSRYTNDDDVRVLFGILLPVKHCSTGACGSYKKKNDTWVITNAIRYDRNIEFGGHEMIITGYDDNAVSVDNEGTQHKGLLIIRNSWGEYAGNSGTYYISYDFFKQYISDVDVVTTTHVPIE